MDFASSMLARVSVALVLGALLAPSASAILDGCTNVQVSVSPTVSECRFHSGSSACPGSASESLFVGSGSTGVGEADSGSCDSSGHRTALVLVTLYVAGAPDTLRWSSGSSGTDPRDITISGGGLTVDWSGSFGGACVIAASGPVTLNQNCLLAAPPGLPGLGYGTLYP